MPGTAGGAARDTIEENSGTCLVSLIKTILKSDNVFSLSHVCLKRGPAGFMAMGYVRNEPLAHFKQITRDFRLRMVEKIMSCRPLYDAFSSVVFASHSSSFSRVRPVTAQARLGHWAGAARPPDSIASASSIPTPRRACTKRVANPPWKLLIQAAHPHQTEY